MFWSPINNDQCNAALSKRSISVENCIVYECSPKILRPEAIRVRSAPESIGAFWGVLFILAVLRGIVHYCSRPQQFEEHDTQRKIYEFGDPFLLCSKKYEEQPARKDEQRPVVFP
uniref:CX domain-containing protein n=1 Tax=Steinernema glaseri TaxID=37863 RepID=A0A1I7Z172_9BILA